jgi:hypothetical protein
MWYFIVMTTGEKLPEDRRHISNEYVQAYVLHIVQACILRMQDAVNNGELMPAHEAEAWQTVLSAADSPDLGDSAQQAVEMIAMLEEFIFPLEER